MSIDIEAVTDAYIATLLWSESCNGTAPAEVCDHLEMGRDCDASLESLNYDADDIAAESMIDIRNDVEAFCESNAADLADMDPSDIGHNFLLTRNRHGAGFWDCGLGAKGDRLTEASRPYGTTYAYVGDDGMVYVS